MIKLIFETVRSLGIVSLALATIQIYSSIPGHADGTLLQQKRKIEFESLSFSQSQFRRLNQAQLEAIKDSREKTFKLGVSGFTPGTPTTNLLCLAVCMRGRTMSLLRRLPPSVSDLGRRREILEDELEWAENLSDKVFSNIERLMDKQTNVIVEMQMRSENERLERLRCYIKGLRKWRNRPVEGT